MNFKNKIRISGSLFLVLFCGLLQGYWGWETFRGDIPTRYPLSFKEAEWITPPTEAPQGYFRRDYAIPEQVASAWIQITASDQYILYVNGHRVEERTYVGLNVSGIHDLTSLLKRGKNVIAVRVQQRSYPGVARLAVQGGVLDRGGRRRAMVSDASWRVAIHEERLGNLRWHAEAFDMARWPSVRTMGKVAPDAPEPVDIYPEVMMQPPRGQWIRHPEMGSRNAYFEKWIELPSDYQAAWVRIASAPGYMLSLNGIRVGQKQQFNGEMDIYDVTSLLSAGRNHLGVSIQGNRVSSGLLLDGYLLRDKTLEPFVETDGSWTAMAAENISTDLRPRTTALPLTDHSITSGGSLTKKLSRTSRPSYYQAEEMAKMLGVSVMVALILTGLWYCEGRWLQVRLHLERNHALSLSAAMHVPPLLFALLIFLLSFDVRYPPSYFFQRRWVSYSLLLLCLCKLSLLLEATLRRGILGSAHSEGDAQSRSASTPKPQAWMSQYGFVVGVMILTLVGFLVRFSDIAAQSLTHDEVSIVDYAKSILETGHPYKYLGALPKLLTTYELLPYPVALSIFLLGESDVSVRVPALLFGTAVIPLIACFGAMLFRKRVGLLAALIYTCSPWAIIWSQNVFYPQQCQLATLATAYLFYRAIESEQVKTGYLYSATGLFLVTYLTWEPGGFLLPGLGIGLLAMKGRDLRWLGEKSLWKALGVMGLVIFLQQARRILYQVPPYLVMGAGRSDVSTPSLFFLDPMYDPTFYLKNFFWLENHAAMTTLVILGAFWVHKSRNLAYLYALLGTVMFLMTHLLSATAVRYGYYMQPFLILSAAAVCMRMVEGVASWVAAPRLILTSYVKGVAGILLPVTLFLASQDSVLHLYRLSTAQATPLPQTRRGVYAVDYRSAGLFLRHAFQEGDLIIPVMPHAIEHYAGKKSHYYMNINLVKQMGYDISGAFPGFLDKYTGNPVLRSAEELKDILERHRRVWFVIAPMSMFTDYADPRLVSYIERNSRIVHESHGARIYLWEQ